ncbi:hypothetical protein ACEQ8H_005811 [Pleosporales sp. CAS-2024a]
MGMDVIALITPKPGKADRVEELLVKAAESVKANEPGTLRYHLQRETAGDAPMFIVLETYKDMESAKLHGETDYFNALKKSFGEEDLLAQPLKIILTKEVGGFASRL